MLKSFRVTDDGSFVDGMRISPVTIQDINLAAHRSIRLTIEVRENARHPGGLNIFGRGFVNYDQDILLRLTRRD